MTRLLPFLCLVIGLLQVANAATLHHCYDGDTCHVMEGEQRIKVRVWGIDAPELKQDYGRASRNRMSELLSQGDIALDCRGKSWERKVCRLSVNGQDAGAQLVQEGLAWDAPKYSKGHYANAQKAARTAQRGLWAHKQSIRPACYRKPDSCKEHL